MVTMTTNLSKYIQHLVFSYIFLVSLGKNRMEKCLLSFVNLINCLAFKQRSQQIKLNGCLDALFLSLVFVPILMTSTDPTRRSKLFCHSYRNYANQVMQALTKLLQGPLLGYILWIFVYRRLVKRHGLASQTRGRNLRFVYERPEKFLIVYRCWHW